MPKTKPAAKPKPVVAITKSTLDINTGKQTSTTKTFGEPEKPKNPADEQARLEAQFGLYGEVLDAYPEFEPLVKSAVAAYMQDGKGWTEDRFWQEFNKTQYAQDRTKNEELFDIESIGPNADTYQKKVDDTYAVVKQNALRLGVPVNDQQMRDQARNIVRSDLSQGVVDKWWAAQYGTLAQPGTADQIAGQPLQGAASQIQKSLQDTARSYGLKISDELLRSKTGEALGQGERWQEYLQGQEDYFRQQAKLMYPNAAALFDSQNLTQISEGYLQEASSILGTASAEMDITDPKWTAFLNGADGKILSKDEWTRVLRTDSKYGYDKSLNARKEYSNLTDELFTAFGMA